MYKFNAAIFSALLLSTQSFSAIANETIPAPIINISQSDVNVTINWNMAESDNYRLYYAPYPYQGESTINYIELGKTNSFSYELWEGAAYYVAVKTEKNEIYSDYSNIELIQISDTTSDNSNNLPQGLQMMDISGGSFIMGNNDLKGPQAGQATEHSVSLSAFQMSETEISNSQYLEFLNSAYKDGLIEVINGELGSSDHGQRLITGTGQSKYSGKVLYNLDGTRVMKDHDNADGDNDPFTGVIEPENPLNLAYIDFDSTEQVFYLKDPRNAEQLNWLELCNYYNYSDKTKQNDTSVVLNDFENWPELSGWTQANPDTALLPTLSDISNWPVTFIRWWGAYAFADYYGLKLPSEAQWEYAAKGGQNFNYAVYDGVSTSDANWNKDQLNPALHHVLDVKSGNPNPFGLYNLGGNVWEWVADNYTSYDSAAVTDPLVEVEGSTTYAWRGGSWNYHEATLETSARYSDDESRGNDHFGFRVVNKN